MGEHALTHCLPRLRKVVEGEQGGISAAVGWQGGGGFRCLALGAPLFDAHGEIDAEVRFTDLAAFLWMRETGQSLPAVAPGTPLLGSAGGTAYYLSATPFAPAATRHCTATFSTACSPPRLNWSGRRW